MGAGTLIVRGSTASIGVASASAPALTIGGTANGSLLIDNGAIVKNITAKLGGNAGTLGAVTVDGANSRWNFSATTGTALSLTAGTSGSLTVSNGGAVTFTTRSAAFAPTTGQTADFVVTGANSTFTTPSALTLGGAGTTTVMISADGKVTSTTAAIGTTTVGGARATDITVTGAGSSWITSPSSILGMDGNSTLNIVDGGTFTTGSNFAVGNSADAVCTINVGGNGATLNAGTAAMALGVSGSTAILNLSAGGTVNARHILRLGQGAATSHAVVNQTGGIMNISQYLYIDAGTPEYHLLGGTLMVGDASSAGISIVAPTSYIFELGGGTLQAKGSQLTSYANATLRAGTVSTLSTPTAATQIMYWEGSLSGTGGLLKTGSGSLFLDAANNPFSGRLTIEQGTVNPVTAASLGTSGLIFSGNSTLQITKGSIAPGNDVAINMGITATMDVASGNTLTLSGAVTGAGGLAKTSTGTLVLSGTNNYSGATRVSAGTLQFAKTASLYNGATASWTAANLTVASGATAAFNVGGAGEFTAGNLDIVKGLGTATGGFLGGSVLGLDTSNAGGNFTYGGIIANTSVRAAFRSMAAP
ncbi:MAG: autotransporter [Chthoniobacteraceae bacterium]|nr:autotransporter [Chthoniobacteraceae bacterium]